MALPPLAGYTVAVTADRRRDEQVELLRRRGAEVVEGPTVRTAPLIDDSALRAGIDAVVAGPPDVTVLLTGLGVRSLLGAAESQGRGDALLAAIAGSEVHSRGPKATGAAVTAGIDVAWSTAGERSSELLAELSDAARAGARIAVQRDGAAEPHLAAALAGLGADVVDIPVYRWSMPDDVAPAQRLLDAACARSVDAVTFTSSPALRNLFALADAAGQRAALLAALDGPVLAVCVGPVCAQTAAALGIGAVVVPARARLGAMVLALAAELGGRSRAVELGGRPVTLQGGLALIGGEEVRLTDRERDVLRALVDAGGAVVPKRALLRDVWGGASADEHAVEVTVSRLRTRLGPLGNALRTVPRRGYRLV
jgi:uroporphyrinogen-III synthase